MTRFNLYPADGAPLLGVQIRSITSGPARADADRLRKALVRHGRGRADLFIHQPRPGYLTALPHVTRESDGPGVDVPLDGLRWEVAP